MKWFRFFWAVVFLIVLSAPILAAIWYGMPEWLDGRMLWSVAMSVFVVSEAALFLALLILAGERRWWRKPKVRQRLPAFFWVSTGVLFLNSATYAAITLRASEFERGLSSPLTELNWLFKAMSTVSMTLIFACLFLIIHLSRYAHDEAPGADEDR